MWCVIHKLNLELGLLVPGAPSAYIIAHHFGILSSDKLLAIAPICEDFVVESNTNDVIWYNGKLWNNNIISVNITAALHKRHGVSNLQPLVCCVLSTAPLQLTSNVESNSVPWWHHTSKPLLTARASSISLWRWPPTYVWKYQTLSYILLSDRWLVYYAQKCSKIIEGFFDKWGRASG